MDNSLALTGRLYLLNESWNLIGRDDDDKTKS